MEEIKTAVLIIIVGLGVLFLLRRNRKRNAIDWQAEALARMQQRGSKPDMAFSAGRDAASEVGRAREYHILMLPEAEPQMRAFYLDLLGMTEMRAPNPLSAPDGFWAVIGRRRVYFGLHPAFEVDLADIPTLAVPSLDTTATTLDAAGHRVVWDTRYAWARRLGVLDPAGNTIALIGG